MFLQSHSLVSVSFICSRAHARFEKSFPSLRKGQQAAERRGTVHVEQLYKQRLRVVLRLEIGRHVSWPRKGPSGFSAPNHNLQRYYNHTKSGKK